MIVLDATILIAHLSVDHPHAAAALDILETEEELVVHPITLAELLVHPARSGTESLALEALDKLGIGQVEYTASEGVGLARARATTGLKMPDCCVLVAAEHHGAELATFDRRLAKIAHERGTTVRT